MKPYFVKYFTFMIVDQMRNSMIHKNFTEFSFCTYALEPTDHDHSAPLQFTRLTNSFTLQLL